MCDDDIEILRDVADTIRGYSRRTFNDELAIIVERAANRIFKQHVHDQERIAELSNEIGALGDQIKKSNKEKNDVYCLNEWKTVAKSIVEVIAQNGFDHATFANLPTKLLLVITELNELVRYVSGEESDPIEEELADCTIRLLHTLETLAPDGWHMRFPSPPNRALVFNRIEILVWPIVSFICMAMENWRHKNQIDTITSIELALSQCMRCAIILDIDLLSEVKKKNEKNKGRGYLHGKKEQTG